jgi:signal transduction histidine kinase
MFKNLRNNMMLFNMLTVSLVMLAAFTVIYLVTYSNINRANEQMLQSVSMMFFLPNRTLPDNAPGSDFGPADVPERFSVDYGVSFVLFVTDGRLTNVNSQLDLNDSVYNEAFERIGGAQGGTIMLADRKWLYAVAPTPPQNSNPQMLRDGSEQTRIVFLDVTHGVRILRSLLLTLICVGLGVLAALFFVSYRFAIRAVHPIEESYNKQKRFVADASHELRTPLAIIGANVDAITSSGDESVESQNEWFDYIRAELVRTGKLVDDLLCLAKSEEIKSEDDLAFDLSRVCETVCASTEAALYESGISIEKHIEKNIIAIAAGGEIARVLYILIDNAGKYTPRGGNIVIVLTRSGDRAVVKVTNSGEGILPADLPRIFDRFYRADTARSAESGGFGLGLSIAKTIIDCAGGAISVESGTGLTTFTVKLRAG